MKKYGACLAILALALCMTPGCNTKKQPHWSKVDTAAIGVSVDLHGVWVASTGQVFAVGDNKMIAHFDGQHWSVMDTYGLPAANLRSVWGTDASNVYAAGESGVILHYNGAKWTEMTVPTTVTINRVWGLDANHVYAVGDHDSGLGYAGTVLFCDGGATWSAMAFEHVSSGDLDDIWGSSANVLYAGGPGFHAEYDGTQWTPGVITLGNYYAFWGIGTEYFIAGVNANMGPPLVYSSFISHIGGANPAITPVLPGTGYSLFGLWGSATNDVYAVGQSGTIYHYNGSADEYWKDWSYPGVGDLRSIHGNSAENFYIVGLGATILHYGR